MRKKLLKKLLGKIEIIEGLNLAALNTNTVMKKLERIHMFNCRGILK